eukprot:763935-Hanusia_phi.AAC.2
MLEREQKKILVFVPIEQGGFLGLARDGPVEELVFLLIRLNLLLCEPSLSDWKEGLGAVEVFDPVVVDVVLQEVLHDLGEHERKLELGQAMLVGVFEGAGDGGEPLVLVVDNEKDREGLEDAGDDEEAAARARVRQEDDDDVEDDVEHGAQLRHAVERGEVLAEVPEDTEVVVQRVEQTFDHELPVELRDFFVLTGRTTENPDLAAPEGADLVDKEENDGGDEQDCTQDEEDDEDGEDGCENTAFLDKEEEKKQRPRGELRVERQPQRLVVVYLRRSTLRHHHLGKPIAQVRKGRGRREPALSERHVDLGGSRGAGEVAAELVRGSERLLVGKRDLALVRGAEVVRGALEAVLERLLHVVCLADPQLLRPIVEEIQWPVRRVPAGTRRRPLRGVDAGDAELELEVVGAGRPQAVQDSLGVVVCREVAPEALLCALAVLVVPLGVEVERRQRAGAVRGQLEGYRGLSAGVELVLEGPFERVPHVVERPCLKRAGGDDLLGDRNLALLQLRVRPLHLVPWGIAARACKCAALHEVRIVTVKLRLVVDRGLPEGKGRGNDGQDVSCVRANVGACAESREG